MNWVWYFSGAVSHLLKSEVQSNDAVKLKYLFQPSGQCAHVRVSNISYYRFQELKYMPIQ